MLELKAIETFLACEGYDRGAALELLDAAKGISCGSWAQRCLAVLLLEKMLLRLDADETVEFDSIIERLPQRPAADASELRRRMSRLARVHEWDDLLHTARQVSKLTLARYVFTHTEIAQEIGRQVGSSSGVRKSHPELAGLPDFETGILERLCEDGKIYWVAEHTGSELNSLVEYPLTTAVLVIKLPGSDIEFEFKRAGVRGSRLLDVIYELDGKHVPTSHRLHGGSMGWLGGREAESVALFSKIYLLVHGKPCPCSHTVMISSIAGVPTAAGEKHIVDYLTNSDMHQAMRECVAAFPKDTNVPVASYTGETGLTLQFIGQALPQQAVLAGSSSFRLDRVALYLSDAGPQAYFDVGLGRSYTVEDARRLADDVLEEILGVVVPPRETYSNHAEYVRGTLAMQENRRRADANYLSVMAQIGECWGTLLAVRGFSDGESFVLRNAGLKSIWNHADWQVRIIFQDHDDLQIAGRRYQHFWPLRAVPGMVRDSVHILGGPLSGAIVAGEIGTLRNIYQVSDEVAETGLAALEDAMLDAYRKTQAQFDTSDQLRSLFFPEFVARIHDFDNLIAMFLDSEETWKAKAHVYLAERDYPETLTADYLQAIPQFHRLFRRLAFLYK